MIILQIIGEKFGGMEQVNIHFMLAEETYDKCLEVLDDIKNDPRLKGVRALVILSLKKKGNIISKSSKEYEQIYPKEGWVEHNPMEIWS